MPSAVTPKYLLPADVEIPGVAFANPQGISTGVDRWYATTLSNQGASSQDDMLVYSDVWRLSVPIQDAHSGFTLTTSGTYLTLTIASADHGGLLGSSRFPSVEGTIQIPLTVDGLPDDSMDKPDRTAWFSASFDGATGELRCVSMVDGTCTVQRTATGYVLGGGTWTFRTTTTATVRRPDTSYMHFGWWHRQWLATGAVSYGVFSDTGLSVDSTTHFPMLRGTAAYIGRAIGHYAVIPPAGEPDSGSFKAKVQFSADFTLRTISGVITNFDANNGWRVALKESSMAADGTITGGGASWTIGGVAEDGGSWVGTFHHESTPAEGVKPEGIAGTFNAQYGDSGRMVGAFGATR